MDAEPRRASDDISSDVWQAVLTDEELDRLRTALEAFAAEPFMRMVAQSSLTHLHVQPGQRVLDAGCGSGVLLPALAAAVGSGGTVVGVDYSPAFLREARQRVEEDKCGNQVELVEGDITALPFTAATFDAAHVERVLMHLEDPDEALRELRRVVRPGGWVVAVEPDYGAVRVDHPDQDAMRRIIAYGPAVFRNPEIGLELKRRMAAAGFVNARLEVLVETENDLHPDSLAAFQRAADSAVALGEVTKERATAVIQLLREASNQGTYVSYDHMVIAVAQVPLV